jgi:RNA polymerase sigma factor (sigma-70 family)
MTIPTPVATVYLVDDDALIRRTVGKLIEAAGYTCHTFESARAYLEAPLEQQENACLVLDIRMPEMSGLELQKCIPGTDHDLPIVFMTAFGDIPTCVQTLKAGAINFIAKPFSSSDLLDAIREALQHARSQFHQKKQQRSVRARARNLSRRERDVLDCVVQGMPNKQIAETLAISEHTVKVHRRRVMSKMEADSVAELVRLAAELNATP